ncbi:hypothetical protein [Hyphomicrobium methylovorum]|uniref:hypothetical protein n=1 Tax=Hyphomicrobium methylovorum TaxID=84 RepID=UPI0015E75D30|nr:hypothetical protein [Hyphomicrobium methylovorum]
MPMATVGAEPGRESGGNRSESARIVRDVGECPAFGLRCFSAGDGSLPGFALCDDGGDGCTASGGVT